MSKPAGSSDDSPSVVDNQAAQRIELRVDDATAFIDYQVSGKQILLNHTEVPASLQGKGVGSAIVRGALDLARQRGLQVVPICPFVASYLKRHPEDLDLVSDEVARKMNLV